MGQKAGEREIMRQDVNLTRSQASPSSVNLNTPCTAQFDIFKLVAAPYDFACRIRIQCIIVCAIM